MIATSAPVAMSVERTRVDDFTFSSLSAFSKASVRMPGPASPAVGDGASGVGAATSAGLGGGAGRGTALSIIVAATSLGEVATTRNCGPLSPSCITAPATTAVRTFGARRAPFSQVPLRLPRSVSDQAVPSCSKTAWLADTTAAPSPVMTSSNSGSRPMRTGVAEYSWRCPERGSARTRNAGMALVGAEEGDRQLHLLAAICIPAVLGETGSVDEDTRHRHDNAGVRA